MDRGSAGQGEPAADVAESLSVVCGNEVERLPVDDRRLVLRPAALGLLGRADEVEDGTRGLAGLPPVACKRGGSLTELGRRLLEELGHTRVTDATLGARQQLVRDIADEHMLEAELL